MLVVQPIMPAFLESFSNYPAIQTELENFAGQEGVVFMDFNGRVDLDPGTDFVDGAHLNSSGARKFNVAVLDFIRLKYPVGN